MSTNDLIKKTKFERQIPYAVLLELASFIKKSMDETPIIPGSMEERITKIADKVYQLDETRYYYQEGESELIEGIITLANVREEAYELAALVIRFICSLPTE
jgi:hypothetical protein